MRERHIDPGEHTVYSSLRQFMDAGEYPPGVLTVMHGGLPIDIRHEPLGHDTTTVFFHSALSPQWSGFPVFTGLGISKDLPTNRVFITDPSLYLHDKLMLGWYAGNRKQPRLQWAIRGILNRLIPAEQRVVTFGASGGGFAALYYAGTREGAVAVPVNPQTNLARYLPAAVARYAKLAWALHGEGALNQMPAVTDLARVHRAPGRPVFYVQNQNDPTHMKNHFTPFMDGLSEGHSVHPVLVDGEQGHRPPPKSTIRAVLAAAVNGDERPPS
ncbi:hypothetical protein [Brachybacterium sp.]|uniref:hypothetical protein n=1 Tax=Brachybacterium sp. TaxID=1891286 RepID=UPI002ED2F1B6